MGNLEGPVNARFGIYGEDIQYNEKQIENDEKQRMFEGLVNLSPPPPLWLSWIFAIAIKSFKTKVQYIRPTKIGFQQGVLHMCIFLSSSIS